MILGIACLILTRTSPAQSVDGLGKDIRDTGEGKVTVFGGSRLGKLLRRPPRLPPRLPPEDNKSGLSLSSESKWKARQESVKKAFVHAWLGYKKYAMGYDELMPLSQKGVDGLGGLGATVVDALDTAMIMGADEIVLKQAHGLKHILRVGLVKKGNDVVLHDSSAHPAPGELSSTSEVSTLQLEFNYLSTLSGDPKYSIAAMKVLEHLKGLPKEEGLVPIYINIGEEELAGAFDANEATTEPHMQEKEHSRGLGGTKR
ncbi:Glycoside hydrolase [Parasponia andersonii]|uniref:alpha-1,2-Mannosidase n=1 Tax=Parasponia andersonii TaxID=3476 RepID=A0A2P5AAZ4_PARAD|nr:Glycoside hydrolase [Parasponia andersonii]